MVGEPRPASIENVPPGHGGRECLSAAERIARETAGELFGAMGTDELTALRDTLSRFVDSHREPTG